MINEWKAQNIEDHLKFKYSYIDFFYAYCEAKGIEDIEENENISDEEYDAIETEFFKKITPGIIDKVMRDTWKFVENDIKKEMEKLVQGGN